MIRFSLVHSCKLVATRHQSEVRLVSASSGRIFTFHILVILDPSEESSHGGEFLRGLALPAQV